MDEQIKLLKVSSKSDINKVALAIKTEIDTNKKVYIQTVGAGALNQAVKSIIIARQLVVANGLDIYCIPVFKNIMIDGKEIVAIRFIVKSQE